MAGDTDRPPVFDPSYTLKVGDWLPDGDDKLVVERKAVAKAYQEGAAKHVYGRLQRLVMELRNETEPAPQRFTMDGLGEELSYGSHGQAGRFCSGRRRPPLDFLFGFDRLYPSIGEDGLRLLPPGVIEACRVGGRCAAIECARDCLAGRGKADPRQTGGRPRTRGADRRPTGREETDRRLAELTYRDYLCLLRMYTQPGWECPAPADQAARQAPIKYPEAVHLVGEAAVEVGWLCPDDPPHPLPDIGELGYLVELDKSWGRAHLLTFFYL